MGRDESNIDDHKIKIIILVIKVEKIRQRRINT